MKSLSEYSPEQIVIALQHLVKLQSHYAHLLNMYDGGHRMEFESAEHWMQRLEDVGDLEQFLQTQTPKKDE